jgi:hypothetical protein
MTSFAIEGGLEDLRAANLEGRADATVGEMVAIIAGLRIAVRTANEHPTSVTDRSTLVLVVDRSGSRATLKSWLCDAVADDSYPKTDQLCVLFSYFCDEMADAFGSFDSVTFMHKGLYSPALGKSWAPDTLNTAVMRGDMADMASQLGLANMPRYVRREETTVGYVVPFLDLERVPAGDPRVRQWPRLFTSRAPTRPRRWSRRSTRRPAGPAPELAGAGRHRSGLPLSWPRATLCCSQRGPARTWAGTPSKVSPRGARNRSRTATAPGGPSGPATLKT